MGHCPVHPGHMQVHHGSLYVGMPQLFFDGYYIHALFEQVRSKRMHESVYTSIFIDACFLHRQPKRLLYRTMTKWLSFLSAIK